MLILIPLAAAILCIAIDIRDLIRAARREVWTSICIWGLGIAAVVCATYKVEIPSPLYVLMAIYEPINRLLFFWL